MGRTSSRSKMIELDFQEAQKLRNNGKINKAVRLYQKIRNSFLKENPHLATECLHMIGVAYYQKKDFNKAEVSLEEALIEFGKDNNLEFAGFVLRDLGTNARANERYGEAESYLRQSISNLHQVGNKVHEGMSKVKLGRVYADQGKYEEALREIYEGSWLIVTDKEGKESWFFLSTAFLDRAKVYLQIGNINQAKNDAKESLEMLNAYAKPNEFTSRRKEIKKILGE